MEDNWGGKYLGMRLFIGRTKKIAFKYAQERLWTRIMTWKGRKLSKVGKEILLKIVVQALPTYVTSCYLLPKKTCEESQWFMNSFWWGE